MINSVQVAPQFSSSQKALPKVGFTSKFCKPGAMRIKSPDELTNYLIYLSSLLKNPKLTSDERKAILNKFKNAGSMALMETRVNYHA